MLLFQLVSQVFMITQCISSTTKLCAYVTAVSRGGNMGGFNVLVDVRLHLGSFQAVAALPQTLLSFSHLRVDHCIQI